MSASRNSSAQAFRLIPNGGRREHRRFSLALPAEYTIDSRRFSGRTANLSSRGVFLVAEDPPPVGKNIRVVVEWPAMLDGRCPLNLVIHGKTVRRELNGAAVRILRYEFRIRAPKLVKPVPTARR